MRVATGRGSEKNFFFAVFSPSLGQFEFKFYGYVLIRRQRFRNFFPYCANLRPSTQNISSSTLFQDFGWLCTPVRSPNLGGGTFIFFRHFLDVVQKHVQKVLIKVYIRFYLLQNVLKIMYKLRFGFLVTPMSMQFLKALGHLSRT